jgi:hypothetical protein
MKQFEIHATSRVGLDSVVEQKSNYERRGFVASSLGKIRCMSHRLSLRPDLVTASKHDSKLTGLHLVDVKEIQHGILSQSDCDHTGFKRDCLWRDGIINREDFFGLALVEDEKSIAEDSVHGWVAVRRASEGYRLGPVYARNTVASRTLIMAAMQTTAARASTFTEHETMPYPDVLIAAEVWGGNPDAVGIFEELGWDCTGVDYYRMWLRGDTPPQQRDGGLAHRGMFAIFDAVLG